jgi:hypothetical protein
MKDILSDWFLALYSGSLEYFKVLKQAIGLPAAVQNTGCVFGNNRHSWMGIQGM